MAITQEQVFQIADQLHAANDTPTLAKVRKALGGGSFTTISEHMNEWKAKQQASHAPMRNPAPESITQRLTELGAEIWSAAQEQANTQITGEREALEATRKQIEATRQEATELADQLSTELDNAQQQIQTQEQEQQALQRQLEQLQHEATTLQQKLATSDARNEEISKRTADLKDELKQAHREREQAQQTAAKSRETAARLQGELTATQAQNTVLLGNLTENKKWYTQTWITP